MKKLIRSSFADLRDDRRMRREEEEEGFGRPLFEREMRDDSDVWCLVIRIISISKHIITSCVTIGLEQIELRIIAPASNLFIMEWMVSCLNGY